MQVTFELPEALVLRLPQEPEELAEVVARGLRRTRAVTPGPRPEIVEFLASGPSPAAILEYRASTAMVNRSRQLLEKNTEGVLTDEEAAEMEELAQLDSLVALLKAEARKRLPPPL